MRLRVDVIRTDGGTQPRAATEQRTVTEYAEDMKAGAQFPPVVVYHDGKEHWLADGFHRVLAARVAGLKELEADVRMGTKRDALLHACGANSDHGMRRTNDDKRRAVLALLQDREWSKWSDREIARRCRVGHPLVAEVRAGLTGSSSSDERTYTTKHGTQATMDTGGIGRNAGGEPRQEHARPEPELQAEPEPEAEPVVQAENTWPEINPEAAVGVLRTYVDTMLQQVGGISAQHMVINEMIKYLRGLSIELNKKVGVA